MAKSLLRKLTAKKPKRYRQYNTGTQSVYSKSDGHMSKRRKSSGRRTTG